MAVLDSRRHTDKAVTVESLDALKHITALACPLVDLSVRLHGVDQM